MHHSVQYSYWVIAVKFRNYIKRRRKKIMTVLQNKIDFAVVFTVDKANPNGDPLNGNRPRQDFLGYGEVSDVAIKRKLRNRLQDNEESILVQADDRRTDEFRSIKDRVDSIEELSKLLKKTKTGKE